MGVSIDQQNPVAPMVATPGSRFVAGQEVSSTQQDMGVSIVRQDFLAS